jgi:hypothetical protein
MVSFTQHPDRYVSSHHCLAALISRSADQRTINLNFGGGRANRRRRKDRSIFPRQYVLDRPPMILYFKESAHMDKAYGLSITIAMLILPLVIYFLRHKLK